MKLTFVPETRADYELPMKTCMVHNWSGDWHFINFHGLFNPIDFGDLHGWDKEWQAALAPRSDYVAVFNYLNSRDDELLSQLVLDPILIMKMQRVPDEFVAGAWAIKMTKVQLPIDGKIHKGIWKWIDGYPVNVEFGRKMNYARMSK